MVRMTTGFIALFVALPVWGQGDDPKEKPPDKPATPAQEYQSLKKEYQDALNAYFKAVKNAKTDTERQKAFAESYPQPSKFAPKFLALAEKHAQDPIAVEALIWVATNGFGGPSGKDNPQAKALALLSRDHIQNEKLGQVCQMLTFRVDKQAEELLRGLLDKNPSKEVQGKACLALGQYLKNRSENLRRLKDQPESAKYFESTIDKDYLKELKALDPDKAVKETEALFERAAKEYADIKLQFYGTVGSKAKAELYDIRFLSVGKAAPAVEGIDQDGRNFKLSDYRGKVVLLDFWSQF